MVLCIPTLDMTPEISTELSTGTIFLRDALGVFLATPIFAGFQEFRSFLCEQLISTQDIWSADMSQEKPQPPLLDEDLSHEGALSSYRSPNLVKLLPRE